ncbi:MAG: hypothetical protein V4694_07480 [Pseudomonadota bacterium]
MRKIFVISAFCLLTSCYGELGSLGCPYPSEYEINQAKLMYNTFGTSRVYVPDVQAHKMFGCHYNDGDRIYSYKTFWGEKFILVRYGKPITYYEN